jgi:hypothetical protein
VISFVSFLSSESEQGEESRSLIMAARTLSRLLSRSLSSSSSYGGSASLLRSSLGVHSTHKFSLTYA